jgi:hypothetical protein
VVGHTEPGSSIPFPSGQPCPEQGQKCDLGGEAPAPETDDRQFASGHGLTGEGPGYPEELAHLGHGVDQEVVALERRRCLGGIGSSECRHVAQRELWTST